MNIRFWGSTHLTFMSVPGKQCLGGIKKTWIYNLLITFIMESLNFGMALAKMTMRNLNNLLKVNSQTILRIVQSTSGTKLH